MGAAADAIGRRLRDADQLVALRALRRLGSGRAAGFCTIILIGAVMPLVLAAATGRVVERARTVEAGDPGPLVAPLVVVAVSFVLSQAHAAWLTGLGDALGRHLYQTLSLDLMRIAMKPAGVAHLEDPSVADELERARELGQGWSVAEAVSAFGSVATQVVRAGFATVILAVVAPLAVVPALVGWAGVGRYRRATTRLFMQRLEGQAPSLRRSRYFRELIVGGQAAKESRVFGLTDFLVGRHGETWFGGMEAIFARRKSLDRWAPLAAVVFAAGVGGALVAIADAGLDGRIGIGAAVLAIQALSAIQGFHPVGDEVWQLKVATKVLRNARDAERIADHPAAALQGAQRDVPASGGIQFENVSFAYPGTSARILDGLDLTVEAGTSLAVVGANGAGKTTLIKLLCRLYDPTEGRISVGGVDIRELSPEAWRRQVGVIFQDFVRYELSARENLAVGAAHLDDDSVVRKAAEQAGIAATLDAVGWDATLSRSYRGGADLSGGQWQRVALGRALVAIGGGARILILDEPTANLDVRAEAALYDRFLELTRGVTTILISHRFSTVRLADRIVVVEAGRVVEAGSHDELLRAGGRYAEMFTAQAAAYHDDVDLDSLLDDADEPESAEPVG